MAFPVATGHLNHATLEESLKQKEYVSSVSLRSGSGVGVRDISGNL